MTEPPDSDHARRRLTPRDRQRRALDPPTAPVGPVNEELTRLFKEAQEDALARHRRGDSPYPQDRLLPPPPSPDDLDEPPSPEYAAALTAALADHEESVLSARLGLYKNRRRRRRNHDPFVDEEFNHQQVSGASPGVSAEGPIAQAEADAAVRGETFALWVEGRATVRSDDAAARLDADRFQQLGERLGLGVLRDYGVAAADPDARPRRAWTSRRVSYDRFLAVVRRREPVLAEDLIDELYREPGHPWTPLSREAARTKLGVAVFRLARRGQLLKRYDPRGRLVLVSATYDGNVARPAAPLATLSPAPDGTAPRLLAFSGVTLEGLRAVCAHLAEMFDGAAWEDAKELIRTWNDAKRGRRTWNDVKNVLEEEETLELPPPLAWTNAEFQDFARELINAFFAASRGENWRDAGRALERDAAGEADQAARLAEARAALLATPPPAREETEDVDD